MVQYFILNMSIQTSRSSPLEESEVFHILGNDRRRAIVQLLADHDHRIDVSDVATDIAETESDAQSVPNNLYKSVYVSLQQTHLPQLEEDAVIEYDPESKTIERGPNFDEVLQYANGGHDDESTTLQIHLALALLGLIGIVLSGIDGFVLSLIDPVYSSILVLLLIGASSLYSLLN